MKRLAPVIVFTVSCAGCTPPPEAKFRWTAETHIGINSFIEDRSGTLPVGIYQAIPVGGEERALVFSTAPSAATTLWRYSQGDPQPIARRGAGPGEIALLGAMAATDSGFVALDVGRQSLLGFDGRGRFLGERRLQHAAPQTAIVDRQGTIYWVEARNGFATFVRMVASGQIEAIQSTWPWRRTLRAARLAVVGRDSIAAFSDVTGCVGVVTFATRASSIVGCVDDTLRASVRRAAEQLFRRSATGQRGASIPNFPLEAMIRIGPRVLLLAVPALEGRPAASYLIDLDSITLAGVRYEGAGTGSIEFRPQSGGWADPDAYLTDGYQVMKAVYVCQTTSSRECSRRDPITAVRFPP